jgi:hypothetical protein
MANTGTRLFRAATKLFSDLFLNGTAQNWPVSQDLIDISGLYRWHAACAQLRNCASPSDVNIGKKHEGRRPPRV